MPILILLILCYALAGWPLVLLFCIYMVPGLIIVLLIEHEHRKEDPNHRPPKYGVYFMLVIWPLWLLSTPFVYLFGRR